MFEYVKNPLTALKNGLYPTPAAEPQPKKTIEQIFQENVLEISALCVSENEEDNELVTECIEKCVKAVEKDLELLDLSLPKTSRIALEKHWELFDKALENEESLADWEPEQLKQNFRLSCLRSIEKRWTADAAQQFYRILLISDHHEKITKAHSWSEQFSEGAFYLRDLKDKAYATHPYFYQNTPNVLIDATRAAFEKCYENVMEQKLAMFVKLTERDPLSFSQQLRMIDSKQRYSYPLSTEEKEFITCGTPRSSKWLYEPHLELQVQLFNACAWSSWELFEDLLVEKKSFLTTGRLPQEYIDNYVEKVTSTLTFFDFSLSEKAREKLDEHIQSFEATLEHGLSITGEKAEQIKSEFRELCSVTIKKIWAADAAKTFYAIFLLSDQERISAAQKWSHQFAAGATYFSTLENNRSVDPQQFFPQALADLLEKAFKECYFQTMEEKKTSWNELKEQDPETFHSTMQRLVSEITDPNALSREERELLLCNRYVADFRDFNTRPALHKMVESLRVCMCKGVQWEQFSPWTPEDEHKWKKLFSEEFAELDTVLLNKNAFR